MPDDKRPGPPNNHAVMNEIRSLRAWQEREMRSLHAKVDSANRTPLRHGWLKHILRDLETNPETQYKVHLYAMYWWTLNFALVLILFVFGNGVWQRISVLYLVLVSLYANWATDYGAMSAALAAKGQTPLPELPLERHVDAPEVGK